MIKHFTSDETLTFSVMPPLYRPYYNQWCDNKYSTYDPFNHDPFELRATSTSGSPVIIAGEKFFGFMNETGGSFAYDGCCKLTIRCPAGQTLYYNECCNPYEEWQKYNTAVLADETLYKSLPTQPFHASLEYCTWVDQKRAAVEAGAKDMWCKLNEQFVYDYMKRVEKLGLPKGKLTIDDGWDIRHAPDGALCYGNWQIDREKFPHMERLVKDMTDEGYIPGLWFSPFTMTPNSELAKVHPELLGAPFSGSAEGEASRKLMFINPDPILEKYYRAIFSYYIDMGFKKLKFDMSYGNKRQMKQLLRTMYEVVKSIDPTVEVEAHIPDIFVSRYCDTLRINDAAFDRPSSWRGITVEHYKVCRYSSPDKILNLDHLGTNSQSCGEVDFLKHCRLLMKLETGYPCVSLLPDHFSASAADEFVGMVRGWVDANK